MNINTLANIPPWQWPPDARETIVNTLLDARSSQSDKITAADLAGDVIVMDDEVAELLLSIVQSPAEPEQLRATAAISFGPALEEAFTEGYDDDYHEPSLSSPMFERLQEALRQLYMDAQVPKEVRRRILEASVRSPQDWHADAIRDIHSSADQTWKLTAAFCMRWVRGFDDEILQLLDDPDPEIHYEAVQAAGGWALDGAWPHIVELIESGTTEKSLLLAAIEAAPQIRPGEAGSLLDDLLDSDDEEIAEAASDALLESQSDGFDDEEDEFEDEDDEDDEEDEPKNRRLQ